MKSSHKSQDDYKDLKASIQSNASKSGTAKLISGILKENKYR